VKRRAELRRARLSRPNRNLNASPKALSQKLMAKQKTLPVTVRAVTQGKVADFARRRRDKR
jgi:hypothetical protein